MSDQTNDRVCEPDVVYQTDGTRSVTRKPIKRVNVKKALQARAEGCSYTAIAKQQGVNKSAIIRAVSPLLKMIPGSEQLQEYKAERADFFAAKQFELLNALSPDKIQSMGGQAIVTSAAILFDKERLERGQSTGNQAIHVLLSGSPGASAIHSDVQSATIDAEIVTE